MTDGNLKVIFIGIHESIDTNDPNSKLPDAVEASKCDLQRRDDRNAVLKAWLAFLIKGHFHVPSYQCRST